MAIYFREDCRTLRDSLQLEMVVAQYCLQIRDVRTTAGVPVGDAVGVGVVAELEGHGDPLSHARRMTSLSSSSAAYSGCICKSGGSCGKSWRSLPRAIS